MRVNVYAEEMTEQIEIVEKEVNEEIFTGLRIYLHLPVTVSGVQFKGPFVHKEGDDDSSAVTFWGKKDLRDLLGKMHEKLTNYYSRRVVK